MRYIRLKVNIVSGKLWLAYTSYEWIRNKWYIRYTFCKGKGHNKIVNATNFYKCVYVKSFTNTKSSGKIVYKKHMSDEWLVKMYRAYLSISCLMFCNIYNGIHIMLKNILPYRGAVIRVLPVACFAWHLRLIFYLMLVCPNVPELTNL